MLDLRYEKEYNQALEDHNGSIRSTCKHEKKISTKKYGINYLQIDEKYSELLEAEENSRKNLEQARRKFFRYFN